MKLSRLARYLLLAYCLFDIFIGGHNGGFLPLTPLAAGQYAPSSGSNLSRVNGRFMAAQYNYPPTANYVSIGNAATGTATITLYNASIKTNDGRVVYPYNVTSPIIVGTGSTQELVTPTAVSNCFNLATGAGTCTITASFANTHGFGEPVISGSGGLAEAAYEAFLVGGGIVTADSQWAQGVLTGCTACFTSGKSALASIVPYSTVSIEDLTGPAPTYWNIQQTASTFLATPATLTAVTALPSATPVGAYGTGTYHLAIAYVDAAGQVGPESADFSEAGLATGSFIFSAPAASTGAVGYVVYISLTSGTYSLDYEAPLTASICTLTKIETVTPACAVTNATYGQTGATATVTAITVSTSPVGMLLGGVSGTLLTGNPNGRTTYAYVGSNHLSNGGMPTVSLAFTAGGIGSATPIAIGTVNVPAGIFNQVGRTFRACGKFLNTDVNSSIQNIDIYLDAAGSDVAGSPVKIGGLAATGTGTAAAYEGSFCDTFTTTVSGAGATAGSIIPSFGTLQYALVSSGNVVGNGADTKAAATALLNLAGGGGFENRLSFVHNNTTGNATPTLQSLTLELL